MPYANTHLVKEEALPLTALFHSINVEENPWFMGGKVAVGYPGGEEMVRALSATYWISAHDEVKDNRGWSVMWIKSKAYTIAEVQEKLGSELRKKGCWVVKDGRKVPLETEVVSLGSGESLRIP
jgi:hypothetical protein